MQFTQLEVNANGIDYVYVPYDRGQAGAFVYRMQNGQSVHAPRLVITTKANDATSDKTVVQQNLPRICPSETNCGTDTILGTDLVKTELRFLATTSKSDREVAIDVQIALLQEFRDMISSREVIYS